MIEVCDKKYSKMLTVVGIWIFAMILPTFMLEFSK